MSIPLSLGGTPPREPRNLLGGLLSPRLADAVELRAWTTGEAFGPPVVSASALAGEVGHREVGAGEVVVHLDADSDRVPDVGGLTVVRFDVDVDEARIDDAVALELSAPVVVFAAQTTETARRICGAGRSPGLTEGTGDEFRDAERIADFLAVLAHSSVGYYARARDTADVVRLLAATVAALSGDDVRRAWRSPDAAVLRALSPGAVAATREVLLGVEVRDAQQAAAEVAAALRAS